MAQKIVGYREMVWTCPNCGAKNPGSSRTCKSCGAAMGEDVNFEQQTSAEMLTDQNVIEKAKQGPDVYCAYCGNRNPAGSKTCLRCGADLSEGHEREHGTEHSAHIGEHEHAEAVICPACGTANLAGSLKCAACGTPLNSSSEKEEIPSGPQNTANGQKKGCSRGCLVIILILVLLGVLGPILLNGMGLFGGLTGGNNTPVPNTFVNAIVQSQNWQTSVQVIGPVDSKASAWEDQLPDDARNVRCENKKRYTSDEEVKNSVEVCGTPYAKDLGNGYEQFVQDCVYEVYDSYCQYTVSKTGVIETRRANGSGPNPELPYIEPSYSAGDQSASFRITLLDENGKTYTLTPSGISEYRSYQVGDQYELEINGRGAIVNMEKK